MGFVGLLKPGSSASTTICVSSVTTGVSIPRSFSARPSDCWR